MFLFGLFVIRREFKKQTEAKEKKREFSNTELQNTVKLERNPGEIQIHNFFFLTLSCIPCSQVGEDLISIHIK